MKLQAGERYFQELNEQIRQCKDTHIEIKNCLGQRYIGAGLSDKDIVIHGTPGNALGAYLNGGRITVYGNAQDATGDTLNEGEIIIHGSAGDAAGYAMRGGKILIQGDAGYRTGIHMKAYEQKIPAIVIGGCAGSFLGEYQAGGNIVVLGLNCPEDKAPVGYFCATGMHGGKIFLRSRVLPDLPEQVVSHVATPEDMREVLPLIDDYCRQFGTDKNAVLDYNFFVLRANTKNPYKQLYTYN